MRGDSEDVRGGESRRGILCRTVDGVAVLVVFEGLMASDMFMLGSEEARVRSMTWAGSQIGSDVLERLGAGLKQGSRGEFGIMLEARVAGIPAGSVVGWVAGVGARLEVMGEWN